MPEEREVFANPSVDEHLRMGEHPPVAGAHRWTAEQIEGQTPRIVPQVGECIQDMRRKGVSVVLGEQKLAVALRASKDGAVLGDGRIVLEGGPRQLESAQTLLAQWLAV